MQFLRRAVSPILTWYFRFVPVPPSFLKLISGRNVPAIVTQSNSVIIEALLRSFARRSGCHLESIKALKGRHTTKADTFYWLNFQNAEDLETLRKNQSPESFSTMNIFRGKGPVWSHPSYSLKLMDFIGLLLSPLTPARFLIVIFGEPLTIDQWESASLNRLTRLCKLDFYSNLKVVRGTPFQKFSIQEQIVLGGQDYERALRKLSKSLGISEKKLHIEAKRAFRLIAARPRGWLYQPATIFARFLLGRLFTDIQVRGLPQFAKALKKDTVVLVPMHRSHLDYIITGQVLYKANLNPPLIAAGVNLSFWPLGWIIRSLGGYFVKRNAKQDRLHGLVLKRYVGYLVKRGHLQEFFIEGGRSRSGRMRSPKLGLLKTITNSYMKKVRRDVLFVPVSISYEHVVEDTEYARENTGSGKTEENLISLFRARDVLREKFKEVIVHFGQGIRFSEFRDNYKSNAGGRNLIEDLALDITRKIEGQTSIGLRSLTYLALFLSPTYGLTRKQLEQSIHRLTVAAKWYREAEGDETFALPTPALQRFLDKEKDESHDFSTVGVTTRKNYLGEDLIYVPGNTRYTADFYKNSVAHVYLMLGLLSILDATGKQLLSSEVRPYYEVLSNELLLPAWDVFEIKLNRYIEILLREGILEQDRREAGVRFSEHGMQYCLPGVLIGHLECLVWIYSLFETESFVERPHPYIQNTVRRVYDYQGFIRSAQSQMQIAKYESVLNRTEISSLSAITSALEGLAARGIISFQEQNGKRSGILVEEVPIEEKELLVVTHQALLDKMCQSKDIFSSTLGRHGKQTDLREPIQ